MKHILAVDDNPANLTLVRETLKDDYKVSVVTSGEQALRFLEKKKPDLILLDVCMPGMDGIEVLQHMREMPDMTWKVIILTALADMDMVEESKEYGAVRCLAKPFKPDDMLNAVREVLGD